MKNKILFQLAIISLVAALGTGCTATLHHGKLNGTPSASKGQMGVSDRAENMQKRIGWGTFTVFAIPVAPVTVNGQPDKELMNQIKDAVEHSGYGVKLVENPSDAAGLPTLSCAVKTFKFKNYTYFFPLVFNWGTITMDVAVKSPDGKTLWSKSYTGKGNGMYSFDSTVSGALTKILNDMITDLTSANFKTAPGA